MAVEFAVACEHLGDLVVDVGILEDYLMVGKKSLFVLFCSLCVHSSFQFSFNLDKIIRRKWEGDCRNPSDDAVDSCLIAIFAFWFAIEIPFAPIFSIRRSFM